MAGVIRLDTHVVVWLYTGELERLSALAARAIDDHELVISPMVQLELTYLHEIDRLTVTAAEVVGDLIDRIGLRMSDASMAAVVQAATSLSWTRDPFDRMIVADTVVAATPLLTRDRAMHDNTALARW
jgi:PIN domain nuclease of toxin-antitoxin system